jgi:uncharacterized membrane protein
MEPLMNRSETWSPTFRRLMGSLASLGAIETAYLTWSKAAPGTSSSLLFCSSMDGSASDCGSILNGPYSTIPGTSIPLAAIGCVAYVTVAFLSLGPLLDRRFESDSNRLLLTTVVTMMGVFSVFLISLLFGVLHESCLYCIASAIFSLSLCAMAWFGDAIPKEKRTQGIMWSLSAGFSSLVAAGLLFTSVADSEAAGLRSFSSTQDSAVLLASSEASGTDPYAANIPPTVMTTSSKEALQLAPRLLELNAKMYGAYWCSHCFEQKERLGKEAMRNIPYIECSKEGANSQSSLCKERNIPGYPTWEVNGVLYPGEQALDELSDIVAKEAKKLASKM